MPSRAFRRLAVLTALSTYLLIVAGGVVRVSGSGLGCGETDQWPLCHGALLPPAEHTAIIEFTHRWIAAITTALVITLAVVAWTRYRHLRRVVWPATAVVVLFVVQIALGAITVEYNLPNGVIMLHLANALLLLAVLVHIAVTAVSAGREVTTPPPGLLRLAAVAAGATYLLALSGAFVVDQGAGDACDGWPLCGGGFQLSAATNAVINVGHRFVAGIVVVLLGFAMARLRSRLRGDTVVRRWAMVVNLLILAQVAAGAVMVELDLPPAVRGVHLALASGLWASVVVVAVRTRLRPLRAADPQRGAETSRMVTAT